MHNPESAHDIAIQKLLWDSDMETNHLISTRRPKVEIIEKQKRTCRILDFAVPADHKTEF